MLSISLVCSIAEYFYELCRICTVYKQRVKNTRRYYTPKRLIRDLLSNCFVLLAFLPKILKESLFSKRTNANLKLYTNAQLTGFSFVETILLKFLTLSNSVLYGRKLFSIYKWNSLNWPKVSELCIVEPNEFDTDWVKTGHSESERRLHDVKTWLTMGETIA